MLSAQRKEFDEKKKDESPYPRDFSTWYALDYFRRPRKLKSYRFYITLVTGGACLLFSLTSMLPMFHQMHQAAPVSTAHALFNQNCSNCHDQMFQPPLRLVSSAANVSVSDTTCQQCHDGAPHHANHSLPLAKAHSPPFTKTNHSPPLTKGGQGGVEPREAACASCHREHRNHETLANHVADRHCTECHGDLSRHTEAGKTSAFNPVITDFNRDHPEFRPSLKGSKDPSKIKFNHKAHLDLTLDDLRRSAGNGDVALKGPGAKLTCVDCHEMDSTRRYPLPIRYENHCAQCHQLNVALVGSFAKELEQAVTEFSKTPLPHKEPAVVRAVLRDRLVQFAQKNAVVAGPAASVPRPLPWRGSQSVSDGQWSWATKQSVQAEALLFMNKQWSRTDQLTTCSHCHVEKTSPRIDGLPAYEPTSIPARWYTHSVFNHGSHRLLSCVECHDRNAAEMPVARSTSAADILLPTLQTCRQCHHAGGGARDACIECHRYHDRTKERSAEGILKLLDVVEKSK